MNVQPELARFNAPRGLVFDAPSQALYVADVNNHCIRRIDTFTGEVSTIAGSASHVGLRVGPQARLNRPVDLALLPSGDLVVLDEAENAVVLLRP